MEKGTHNQQLERIRKIISDVVLITDGTKIDYTEKYQNIQQQRFPSSYNYLGQAENPYWLINEYIQKSEDFINFQTDRGLLPANWLLFSIIDNSDDEQPVKYLYGPESKETRIMPSFVFRSFYMTPKGPVDDFGNIMHQVGAVASVIRHKIGNNTEAVQDLSTLTSEVVYIPSAAIDYHILKWCFSYLDERDISYAKEEEKFYFFPKEKYKNLGVDKEVLNRFEKLESRSCTFGDWLVIWGFARCKAGQYRWTARGRDLLKALHIKPSDYAGDIRCLIAEIELGSWFVEAAESFQKEIHYLARFRQNIQKPRGILRFSHLDFKFKDNYVIYLNMVVDENLGSGLKITQKKLLNNEHEIGRRFELVRHVYKLLMAVEFKRVYLGQLVPQYEKSIRKKSVRSATSQIALRNSSHNIGSHVLSRLVTKESVRKLRQELEDWKQTDNQYQPLWELGQNVKKIGDIVEYVAYFYSYLKTRMDFLADIATGTPSLENPRLFMQEVIAGFDKNRILLNRISGTNDFKFKLQIKDCRHCQHGEGICGCPSLHPENDFLVSIVNDVLGQHALYVILENIIRNTAKHAILQKRKEITFTISVNECPDDNSLYRVLVYDDCRLSESRVTRLVTDQNMRLNSSILKKDNTLRNGSWGLIEMDISAAYLRKINAEDIDEARYDIPLGPDQEIRYRSDSWRERQLVLKALRKSNFLAYQFYLPKPKDLLIYDAEGKSWCELFLRHDEINVPLLRKLESDGILYLHGLADPALTNWKLKEDTSYGHQLMVLLTLTNQLNRNYLPQRVITEAMLKTSYRLYFIANTGNKGKDPGDVWDLLQKHGKLTEQAWRTWVLEKMKHNGITEILPHTMYSRFITGRENKLKPFKITLDNHGERIELNMDLMENGKIDFYQDYNHLTKDFVGKIRANEAGSNQVKQDFDYNHLFKFIDGALTNILIIDERIQLHFNEPHPKLKKKKIGDVASKSLIYSVPVDVLNLSLNTYPDEGEELLFQYLRTILPATKKVRGIAITVIHIGVIEKFLKTNRELKRDIDNEYKAKSDIESFVLKLQDVFVSIFREETFVVITSGRGKPDNLPPNLPFLGYSILSQYVIENRFKSHLTEALYAARPKQ
jgi:hypothetical protein